MPPAVFRTVPILFALSLLCTGIEAAQAQEEAETVGMVDYSGPGVALSLKPEEGDAQLMQFGVETRTKSEVKYFTLERPPRVVIDVQGAKGEHEQIFNVGKTKAVKRVRLGIHPDKLRIVLDLNGKGTPNFQVQEDENKWTFVLAPATAGGTVTPVSNVAPTPEAPVKATMAPVPPTVVPPAVLTSTESSSNNIPSAAEEESAAPTSSPAPPVVGALADVNVQGFEGAHQFSIPAQRLQDLAKVEFSVDRMLVVFKTGERPIQDLTLKNPGNKQIFVSAVVQALKNPGSPDEKKAESDELLVSPKRLSLEPGQERKLRLLLREMPPAVERTYNIGFSVNKESFESEYITVEIDGKPAKLRVVTNLSVLALAQPPNPKVLLGYRRVEGGLLIRNEGSTSVRLTGGKVCSKEGNRCLPVGPRRVYPGNEWLMKIPESWSVMFIKDSVLGFEQFFIPAQ